MDETNVVYAYICKGIAGAPAHVHGIHVTGVEDDQPRPVATWPEHTYWMIVIPAFDDFPEVEINVHYEGPLPSDEQRDQMNYIAAQLAGHLLFETALPAGFVLHQK